jgi:RHS repeat-associated protein
MDYLPFGDEILATTQNARSGIGCYSGETGLRQKFTGKERDPESRLDYFIARYYSSASGRFSSPDEWTGGIVDPFTGKQISQPGPLPYADITDPQTINKYAYVRNNPLRYTDPDGHVIDYALDAAGIAFDIKELIENPSIGSVAQLTVDVVLAATPFVPTIGAVKLGGKALDITVDAARTTEAATDVKRAVPNPYGKLGGPAHQAKVDEVARKIEGKGLEATREARIKTPGGEKSARYADVVGKDPGGRLREIHQVGKQTKKGEPVARERRAIQDIQRACRKKVCFDPIE